VLDGIAGTLITVLDAILVNGYGAKAAAGWTKPYTGTNKAAFLQGAGLSHYLRVDDSDGRLARVIGYGAMTDVDTGTNPFPTTGQISGGLYARKSVAASSTARPWICFANDSTFYLFMFGNRTGALSPTGFDGGDAHLGFGTMVNTRVASDINASFICAGSDTSATSTTASDARQCLTALATSAQSTLYTNGSYNQGSSDSTQCHKRGAPFPVITVTQSGVGSTVPFPDPMTGKLLLYPMTVVESSPFAVRGELPGIRALGHVFSGSGTPNYMTIIEGRGASTGVNHYLVGTGSFYCAAITLGDWDG
jgi:hypothetical protein